MNAQVDRKCASALHGQRQECDEADGHFRPPDMQVNLDNVRSMKPSSSEPDTFNWLACPKPAQYFSLICHAVIDRKARARVWNFPCCFHNIQFGNNLKFKNVMTNAWLRKYRFQNKPFMNWLSTDEFDPLAGGDLGSAIAVFTPDYFKFWTTDVECISGIHTENVSLESVRM